jgi:hypothetical protein
MRDLVLTAMAAHGPAAICYAIPGPATARFALAAGISMSRAHSILVASRTQNILA